MVPFSNFRFLKGLSRKFESGATGHLYDLGYWFLKGYSHRSNCLSRY